MGFWRNLFAKSGEIDRLSNQCDYLQSCLDREIWRNEKLEKQVESERKSKDKFVLTAIDQISVKNGLYATFNKTINPPAELPPIPLSAEEESKIEWAATLMRNDDIDNGIEPRALEDYVTVIKENPDRYLMQ